MIGSTLYIWEEMLVSDIQSFGLLKDMPYASTSVMLCFPMTFVNFGLLIIIILIYKQPFEHLK